MTARTPLECDALTPYLLGELADEDIGEFLAHRRDCRRCQAELAAVELAHRSLCEDDIDAECEQIAASARTRTLAAAFWPGEEVYVPDSQAAALSPVASSAGTPDEQRPEAPPAWLTSTARRDRRHSLRTGRRPFRFAAVAASVASLALGVFIGNRMTGSPPPMAPPTLPAEIVRQSALRPVSPSQTGHGNATLVRHGATLQLIISVAGLAPVGARGCYSVWLVDGGSHRLVGEINVNRAGSGALTAPVASGAQFTYIGVTREPNMADRTPLGPRIMGAAFTHL